MQLLWQTLKVVVSLLLHARHNFACMKHLVAVIPSWSFTIKFDPGTPDKYIKQSTSNHLPCPQTVRCICSQVLQQDSSPCLSKATCNFDLLDQHLVHLCYQVQEDFRPKCSMMTPTTLPCPALISLSATMRLSAFVLLVIFISQSCASLWLDARGRQA